ncbi:MAG: hypothetical protein A2W90_12865 [Bacteroidetes bacterium GWF2_42_66]|nr:MAG: hypothetical protein A2W92_22565 [Bacteroidetes bacterium GWA2_42_15]OFY00113.1 MAG: hypothetical protein A2W89_17850 [Bacteroidetes bacterium GWE2_42_39]OFY40256.1 MAG: hypothetical protein A2W90_12865 [Bacteroidetes bacterium GWF2_42_66]HBL73767.1 hypothetical protein [Prolixibacteraceae bacterium]HCR88929.1 hypothetical protein [Prolixibacteraceae bacterium]
MLKKQIKGITVSGYLRLNSDLTVAESGGNSRALFGFSDKAKNMTFANCISTFNTEIQDELNNCLSRAQEEARVSNYTLHHSGKKYAITITPLTGGELILSFSLQGEERPEAKNHEYWHSIHSKTVTLSFNRDLQHIFISGPISDLIGTGAEQIIGKKPEEAGYPEEFGTELEKLLKQAFRQEKMDIQPLDIRLKGNNLFLKIFVYPEPDANGKISLVHLCIVDYESLDKANLQAISGDGHLQMALDASGLGVWEWFTESDIVYFSRKWKSQLGYYPDELDNQFSTFKMLLHEVDRDRVLRETQNFLKSGSLFFETDFRLRHKNGNYLWVSCRATCVRDEKNMAVRVVGVNRDIGNEKKAGDELSIFKQSMMLSPVPIVITDVDGYIEFFNTAYCKKTGWNAEEIIGKKPSILKSGFHSDEFYTKLWKTITSGNVWQGEFKNKRKNGRYFTEFATISPLRNNKGTITHFVKVSEDISVLRKLENDLRTARRSAEVANIYKNNFLANMSHKIRTPINGIIGFSDLLKGSQVNEKQQNRYIDLIQQNSAALLHLIDSIIDVARIEANELKIKKESCSLKDTFIELKPQMQKMAENKGKENISLQFIVPREAHHDVIFTDPIRLKQILLILFENALKQTEKGFIEVGYQIYSDRKLQFYVHDSGVGIGETQLEVLTRQFGMNEKTTGQLKGGMGIGLTISRGLVRLLDGQIGVKSKKGKGSIFYFTIPYDKIKVPTRTAIIEQSKSSKYDFSKYTILIAEDVAYNFEYLKNIFSSTGAKLLWAKDGIDVLKIFHSEKIDLILMDIQLPEISGFDATLQIRQKNKTLPIIAQTGYTMDEDREKCLSVGCNDVLIKPLRIEDVLKTVSRYLK